MQKNVSSQKITLFAFDITTGAPKTGDAANITAYVSKDRGATTVLGDTSATEVDATNAKGVYMFDLTQAETNADNLDFTAKSSTANISISPILNMQTVPASFTSFVTPTGAAVNVTQFGGSAITSASGIPEVKVASIAANAVNASALATDAVTEIQSGLSTLDAAGIRSAVGLASANLDTQLTSLDGGLSTVFTTLTDDTPNAVADALLDRDMSAGPDNGSPTVRTPRQALRFLRNKWLNSAGTLTVYKENDSTASWTASVSTDAAADPIVGNDPA